MSLKVPVINAGNMDIFSVDAIVRKYLNDKITSVNLLQRKLEYLTEQRNNNGYTQKLVQKKVSELRRQIREISSTEEYAYYSYRVADILQTAKDLARESSISFVPTIQTSNTEDELKEVYIQLLRVASDYVTVTNIPSAPKTTACTCGCDDFVRPIDEDNILICSECGMEINIVDDTPNFKDTDRINLATKYVYTREGHFNDAMRFTEGIQKVDQEKIAKVLKILKKEIKRYGLTTDRGKPNSVTKKHVYTFLSEQRLNKHYNDLNLLYFRLTGVKCPEISSMREELLDDFKEISPVIDKVKPVGRINSLTVSYILYKLMKRRGFDVSLDDLFILKTKAKLDEHEETMKLAYEELGWTWYPS